MDFLEEFWKESREELWKKFMKGSRNGILETIQENIKLLEESRYKSPVKFLEKSRKEFPM